MNTLSFTHKIALFLFLSLALQPLFGQRAIFVDDVLTEDEFNYDHLAIPRYELIAAGPGKDGIPAIDQPTFTRTQKSYLPKPEALVIGISHNGVTKAYPLQVLAYHEIVNDDFGGQAVAVTYSPLCGSAQAFVCGSNSQQNAWQFGVSGYLHNNNLVLFDRQSNSLWSQMTGYAISGPAAGHQLETVPMIMTSWENWQYMHPDTKVLTTDTGFGRNYKCDPYAYYNDNDRIIFPVSSSDDRLPNKARVLGIWVAGKYKAYPFSLLATLTEDLFNGQPLQFHYDSKSNTAYATDELGDLYPALNSYWFAWHAFYPDTGIHGLDESDFIQTSMSMSDMNP